MRPDMRLKASYPLPNHIFGGDGAEDHYSDESQRPRHQKVTSTLELAIDKHLTVDRKNQKGPVFEPFAPKQTVNNEWEFFLPLRKEEVGYNDFIAVFEHMAREFIEAFFGLVADAEGYGTGTELVMEFTPKQVIADRLARASLDGKRIVELEENDNEDNDKDEDGDMVV